MVDLQDNARRWLQTASDGSADIDLTATSHFARVAFGGLVAVVALAAKALLATAGHVDVAYLTLFAALPIAAFIAGFPAAATTVLVGGLVDALLFIEPIGAPRIDDPRVFLRFVLFIPIGLWVAWLISEAGSARRAALRDTTQLTAVLAAHPDFLVILDPEGRIEYANPAVRGFGWEPRDLIGRPLDEIIPAVGDGTGLEADARPGQTMAVRSPDASTSPAETLVRHIDLPSGERRLLVTARDVRERVESEFRLMRLASSERSQTRVLQTVVGALDEGIALIAADGSLPVVNDEMSRLAGGPVYRAEDLERAFGRLADGEVHLSAPERWLHLMTLPITEEDGAPVLLIARDVTADRTALATRDAFMGVLSHELRTPITSILGAAQFLTRPKMDADSALRRELASDVVAEALRLHDLIEDLLVLSRAQSGGLMSFEPEPVLLQRAIPEAIEAEARRYPHVRFEADIVGSLPPVEGDRTFAAQVLRNLIGNAGKYAGAGPAAVLVTARDEGDGMVDVRVLDQGPGIDPADSTRLFEIFFRAERTARHRAGSGIGLYVARTLVEAMGGTIWAEPRSADTGGAEFGFRLPIMTMDDLDTIGHGLMDDPPLDDLVPDGTAGG